LEDFEKGSVDQPKDWYRNDLNMKWEWDWLPDGDPADHRL